MMMLEHQVKHILTAFNLHPTGAYTPLNSLSNQVLLAECAQGPMVIKQYTALPADRVEQIALALHHLRSHEIPVSLPMKGHHGAFSTNVGGKVATCEAYITGEPGLGFMWLGEFQKQSAMRLADLHRALSQIPHTGVWGPVSFWQRECFNQRIDQIDRLTRREMLEDSPFVRSTTAALDLLRRSAPALETEAAALAAAPARLIHGDYWPGNILVDPGTGNVICLLDFENAHIGPPILDIAQFVSISLAYARQQHAPLLDFWRLTHFLRECVCQKLLSLDELASLHTTIAVIRLYSIMWILENHWLRSYTTTDFLLEQDMRVLADLQSNKQAYQHVLEQICAELAQPMEMNP